LALDRAATAVLNVKLIETDSVLLAPILRVVCSDGEIVTVDTSVAVAMAAKVNAVDTGCSTESEPSSLIKHRTIPSSSAPPLVDVGIDCENVGFVTPPVMEGVEDINVKLEQPVALVTKYAL
jgi:hypothetical protein